MIYFHFISDVLNLLRRKEFEQFDEMIQYIPHFVNSLRIGDYDTLLMRAVRYDDVFDHILDIPQDFNVVDKYGLNIIHYIASLSDDDRGARRLIKLSNKTNVGSLINQQNVNGDTPLHWAAWENNHQVIKQLIEFRCDVNVRNGWNKLPEEQFGCDEVTKKLIRQAR